MTRLPKITSRSTATAVMVLAVLGLSSAPSLAVSAKIRSACAGDYQTFCPSYDPDSAKARQCMRQVGKRLSQHCIDALADAGEIPRSYKNKK